MIAGVDALFIASGVALTMELLVFSLAIGFVLGVSIAVIRYMKVCVKAIDCFVSVARGTPIILQLSFFYFSIPGALNLDVNVLFAGSLAFGINSAAYVSEIFRGGIESLPIGQFEAARSLHVPRFFTWRDIILPQVIRNVFPSLVNEIVGLLKTTALISTIGGLDIMRRAHCVSALRFTFFAPICIAGALYYALVLLIEYFGMVASRRLMRKG
ncbi:amino acid ABC transporter permease [Candidatus Hydrogenosomobacter endosymbioticus]|uniref:Arginine ABC transporter permease n=1 Tax=Candidatus Hydrogenosomobacter endosymbioticus TaxID=2558174 RepID=A0ABM7V9K7_9PROT|nr:amino acid ABC transporter permease [Candidatus Hydrogenosomobacter endosymbioticus]BDB96475.1 arginine ABC transporter permease [Candidatus Hydrogenosomobacter endosymbioticus]